MSIPSRTSSMSSSRAFPLIESTSVPVDANIHANSNLNQLTKKKSVNFDKLANEFVDKEPDYVITWTNIKYLVEIGYGTRLLARLMGQAKMPTQKLVLKGVSGQLHSGNLMAIMGPSGAGKSTLMESVVGIRQLGVSGGISCSSRRQLRLAFIPQHDEFFDQLTVRECLMFASKMHCTTAAYQSGHSNSASNLFHTLAVNEVLKALELTICADNPISKCSGGQQKRLSIGQELLGSPDVLVLDEPTSGLDSAACMLVIQLLKDLTTDKGMAIMLTIHQPSTKVFNMFDKIFMLSKHGRCVYDGDPLGVLPTLAARGLECPDNYNPGEFLIEVASEEFGLTPMMALTAQQEFAFATATFDVRNSDRTLKEVIARGDFPVRGHLLELVKRSVILTFRDKWLFGLRFFAHTVFAIVIALQLGTKLGPRGGCPPDFDEDFDPTELEAIQIHNKLETDAVFDNAGAAFLQLVIIMFTAILPTVLTFPYEMRIFVKEVKNGWYSIGTYYLSKTLADIPFQVLFPSMFAAIVYFGTNQANGVLWRFWIYALIMILVSLAGQSQGLIIGAVFMYHVTAGVYFAPITMFPLELFSGFFMKVSSMDSMFQMVAMCSYFKFALEATLATLYGFHRCGENAEKNMATARDSMSEWFSDMLGATDGRTGITENFVDNLVKSVAGDFIGSDGKVRSIILNHYETRDEDVVPAIMIIASMAIALRVITYFVVVSKANAKV